MAQKIITALQLRDEVVDGLNIPSDDGIQSYRVTAAQIKAYILAAGNVGTDPLADLGVTTPKIAAEAVTEEKIADEAVTLDKLSAALQAQFVPVGSFLPTARATASPGFLLCDGSAINRTTYADLFAAIGVTHGVGNGVDTFNIPDYRGRFLRGVDGGIARDPNRATRTAMGSGGNTGDAVGSVQDDAIQGHGHDVYRGATTAGGSREGYAPSGSADNKNYVESGYSGTMTNLSGVTMKSDNSNGTPRPAAESRPKNANANFMIKY